MSPLDSTPLQRSAQSARNSNCPAIGNNEPVGRLLTQFLPNSLHFRHGTLLSHFTLSLEHSSHACRFRPRSKELGISEVPRRSHRLKWSRSTSLYAPQSQRRLSRWVSEVLGSTYLRLKVLEQNLQMYGLSPESAVYSLDTFQQRVTVWVCARCC